MPEIIETTVYQLHELSDAAKDKARGWYRQIGFDFDWHDAVYDDFERICAILGVSLATRTVRPFWRRHPSKAVHLVLGVLEPRRWGLL